MYYYLIPKHQITPKKFTEFIEDFRYKFKSKIRAEGKEKIYLDIDF